MDMANARGLMMQIGNLAALRSLVVGELPSATLEQGRQLLADAGLLGNFISDSQQEAIIGDVAGSDIRIKRLFTAQQQRLSTVEMNTLDDHRRERALTDEDFVY